MKARIFALAGFPRSLGAGPSAPTFQKIWGKHLGLSLPGDETESFAPGIGRCTKPWASFKNSDGTWRRAVDLQEHIDVRRLWNMTHYGKDLA